jgi:superfamily II DNA or RNA helicase
MDSKEVSNINESLKKEHIIYFTDEYKEKHVSSIIDKLISENNIIQLNTYQKFIQNIINPHTIYNKILLIHGTGTGKTITSLSIATKFINEHSSMGSIFIIGFTKHIFKRELLRRHEFGIVSKHEVDELNYIKTQIQSYNKPQDIAYLKELKNRYTRRINKKYKFYGYKELYGKLFLFDKFKRLHPDIDTYELSEDEILLAIKNKEIHINKELLFSFHNSLVISDEIHNVYNSFEKNNWGISLQFIFDYYSDENLKKNGHKHYNTLKAILLSATPLVNQSTEIIDIVNLLSEKNNKLTISDIFDKDGKIISDKINILKDILKNKVSFLKEYNEEYYPFSKFIGDSIPGIDFLKFIKCPMSKFHFDTYRKFSNDLINVNSINTIISSPNDNESFNTSGEMGELLEILNETSELKVNLSFTNRYLIDYAIPNPNNSKYGLFEKEEIINSLLDSTLEWREQNKINLIKDEFNNYIVTGDFMLEHKYYNLLINIKNIIKNDGGKIFIYHNFLYNSGAKFIQELLKQNGFLSMDMPISNNSICGVCGIKYKDHEKIISHNFKPTRFISINSIISKKIRDEHIELFNNINNDNGEYIKIIIGSRAIKESFDLRAVRNIFITHIPDNISTLNQIIGRGVRKFSHSTLPKNKQNTNIYILVSTFEENKKNKKYNYSFEEASYKIKIKNYKVIQKLEYILFQNSIDYFINSNINVNFKNILQSNSSRNTEKNEITNYIDFSKLQKFKSSITDINKIDISSYNPYFYQDEVSIIKYMIKRLFLEVSNIWTYEDLFNNIKNPIFHVNFHTKIIDEEYFILALNSLVEISDTYKEFNEIKDISSLYSETNKSDDNSGSYITNTSYTRDSFYIIKKLFDDINKVFLNLNNEECIIYYKNGYYMLVKKLQKIDLDYFTRMEEMLVVSESNRYEQICLDKFIETEIITPGVSIETEIFNSYNDLDVSEYWRILVSYEIKILKKIIENSIVYIFNYFTNKKQVIEDHYHSFYVKFLDMCSQYNIIIYPNVIKKEFYNLYKEYIIPTMNSVEEFENLDMIKIKNYYNKYNKVFDNVIPIGYRTLDNEITSKETDILYYLFHPKSNWVQYYNIIKNEHMKHFKNMFIVGIYDNIKKTNIYEFKLKKNTNIKQKDITDKRKQETGQNCNSFNKQELNVIHNKIIEEIDKRQIEYKDLQKNRKGLLCEEIEKKLHILERYERINNTDIKWIYFSFENFLN